MNKRILIIRFLFCCLFFLTYVTFFFIAYPISKSFLVQLIGVCIGFIGVVMNNIVIVANSWRMPVRWHRRINTFSHFSFRKKDEVKFWYLADIFETKNRMFSIGDTFIWSGFIIMFVGNFLLLLGVV